MSAFEQSAPAPSVAATASPDSGVSATLIPQGISRRRFIVAATGGALGLVAGAAPWRGYAQGKAPINIGFWMFENPQQRPWVHKRVKLFTEKNPNVKVDFQAFAFTDLGKKLSVGFATGTAPEGFITGDWLMPLWLSKGLLAPLDVSRLGYSSLAAYSDDYPSAFVKGAVIDRKVYGYPLWFYAFSNYLNTRQFKEVGLDPERDAPQTWEQLGEVARRLAVKDGGKFKRQGFKFAMHAPTWTMIQFNPILAQCGGEYFDASGKCVVNSPAGVRAMTIRTSIVKRYQAEDPADSIATQPLPGMDWLRERVSIFLSHPLPLVAINSQNPKMFQERYFRAVRAPGVEAGNGFTTSYGFNFVASAQASADKQAVLHDMYRFIMFDLDDCWNDTAPFPLARKSGWTENPKVKEFPDIDEILAARDRGVPHPRTVVFTELADSMHKAVQRVLLSNQDIKTALDEAAAEVDRATVASRKA
jgi:ABC-type glycerol-3-phosphate transport system substrate-binding protein